MTDVSAFFSEFLCTVVLMIAVLAMCDKQNNGTPNGLGPLVIFMVFLSVAVSLGMETGRFFLNEYLPNLYKAIGFGMNPARDLGPRLLTAMVGYGRVVFNFRR